MELFESVMWQYIRQEPAILKDNIYRPDYDILAEGFNDIKEICFIAHGSSYNSAMTVAPFFRKVAGTRVNCITSGNFISSPDYVSLLEKKSTLIVLISQTGNSRGTLQSAELARKHGLATLGISADDSATLKSKTDYFLTLNCGEEDSNAKTKGMSSTILVLLMLAIALGRKRDIISSAQKNAITLELENQCDELADVYEKAVEFCHNNSFGKNLKSLYITGSDMNFGLALEAQIKIMETMCIPTVAVDTEEFSHGTHRSINGDTQLLIIKTDENRELADKTFAYFNTIAPCFMIEAGEGNDEGNIIRVNNHPLTQSVLTIVEIIQIISAYGPEYNHLDPNRAANNEYTDLVDTRI